MEAGFWHQKWESNQIGFHASDANPLLVNNFTQLNLPKAARVYLPLCGKTLDIAWLLDQGYQVVGAELSEIAIQQLFEELGVVPTVQQMGQLKHYQAQHIDMFVGDIFDVTADLLGSVDAIYDRAALVALPPETRFKYTQHLCDTTHKAKQLVICFQYDQTLMSGPPFSISNEEIRQHYESAYAIQHLSTTEVKGGFKGVIPADEAVWLLE